MFKPRLDILPEAQRILWAELGTTPPEFTLYGGTAIALRLGHRFSVDFDFFGSKAFDPDRLLREVPYLKDARILQREENTLTCLVRRHGHVQVSFFGVPKVGRLREPDIAEGPGLAVASLLDLGAMKVTVVQKRAQAKDYLDIDALMTAGLELPAMLAGGKALYGSQFEPQITVKALTYFGDGDLGDLPEELKLRLKRAATMVDLLRLPTLPLPGADR